MKSKITAENKDIRRFAFEMACQFIDTIQQNAERLESSDDIEALHDMRVASRRLRETFQLFQVFYPPKRLKKIMSRVKKITRTLGLAREMDVNVELLHAYKPGSDLRARTTYEYLREVFEAEQSRLRKKAFAKLARLRMKSLKPELKSFARTPLSKSARPRVLMDIAQGFETEAFIKGTLMTLRQKASTFLGYAPDSLTSKSDSELHRLRIDLKKFRYALEIYNPLHQDVFQNSIERAKELQDILGRIHDYDVLVTQLETRLTDLKAKERTCLCSGCNLIIDDLRQLKAPSYGELEVAYASLCEELANHIPIEISPSIPAPDQTPKFSG